MRRAIKTLPLAIMLSSTAYGFQLDFEQGSKWSASLDSTITYGATYRLKSPSVQLTQDANQDDSNRSHDKGWVQNSIRILSDFELKYDTDDGDRYGLFTRATAYYDHELHSRDSDFPNTGNGAPTLNAWAPYGGTIFNLKDFNKETIDRAGRGKELLDLFIFAELDPSGDHPITLRVGRQVINWGESAFIQNGISAFMNPADISKAQLPGTEVKEILRPQGAIYGSIALNENLTFQAYYMYEWERNVLPPTGTFLGAVPDILPEDGGEILLINGLANALPGIGAPSWLSPGPVIGANPTGPIIALNKRADVDADDNGQWGLALNWYAPELNDTEFGFYILNYHNKTPSAYAVQGKGDFFAWSSICSATAGGPPGSIPDPANGCNIPGLALEAIDSTVFDSRVIEDIKLYGFSWNTVITPTSTAWSGEIAYHEDAQVQTMPLAGPFGLIAAAAAPGNTSGAYAATQNDLLIVQTTFNQDMDFVTFADNATAIIEFGWIHTSGLEDGESWLFNGRKDRDSYGYKSRFTFVWYDGMSRLFDVLSGTDLIADINWSHDFEGSAPIAGSGFSDNQKAIGLGLEAIWQNTWSVKLNYTNFFGSTVLSQPDPNSTIFNALKVDDHILGDRDFVSLVVKYRF